MTIRPFCFPSQARPATAPPLRAAAVVREPGDGRPASVPLLEQGGEAADGGRSASDSPAPAATDTAEREPGGCGRRSVTVVRAARSILPLIGMVLRATRSRRLAAPRPAAPPPCGSAHTAPTVQMRPQQRRPAVQRQRPKCMKSRASRWPAGPRTAPPAWRTQ